jgi:hypothetical protein
VRVAAVEGRLEPVPAAVAESSLAALLTGTFLMSAASGPVVQRALPALVVADTDEAKKLAMRCIVLQGQCSPYFGLVMIRTVCISMEEGCPVAIQGAELVQMARSLPVQHLMNFLVALVPAVKASIRCCLTEGLQAS